MLTASGGYEIRVASSSIRELRGVVPAPQAPVSLDEMADALVAGMTDDAP